MKKTIAVGMLLFCLCALIFASGKQDPGASEGGTYRFSAVHSWDLAQGRLDPKDQPSNQYFQFVENKLGIVPLTQAFEWTGGTGYIQSVRLLLASGTVPEAILQPFQTAFVKELYDLGVLIPLDDLLAKHAPLVLAQFTKEDLQIIRSLTPDGKIYYLPNKGIEPRQGMIRADWLKAVGLGIPKTKDELIAVYKAFKEKDANGNGNPNDEIPVSGREGIRWCDDLFVMHGVAMYEGNPEWSWDPVKKVMVSHQASDNMKESLKFLRYLISEGLMDREVPLLPGSTWFAKIADDKVGHYFHLGSGIERRLTMVENGSNPDAEWVYMSPPLVPGIPKQKNYYGGIGVPQISITTAAKNPAKILEWYNWTLTEEGKKYQFYGLENINYKVLPDGTISSDGLPAKQRFMFIQEHANYDSGVYKFTKYGAMKAKIYDDSINDGRSLDNLGMPSSVYDGYDAYRPENMGAKYRLFASKYILGELPENSWDAYVADWRAKGGDEITKRATDWYKKVHNIK